MSAALVIVYACLIAYEMALLKEPLRPFIL